MQQRSEEWFDARIGMFTASRFGDLMAGLTTETFLGLVADKAAERRTGKRAEVFTTFAMQHGVDTEAEAREWYEFTTGNSVIECGFLRHMTLPAGASPDGLVGDDGIIEIKCPQPRGYVQLVAGRKVPPKYRWQMQGQLWVTGRAWCDFVVYHPDFGGSIVRVEASSEDAAALEERVAVADKLVESYLAKL